MMRQRSLMPSRKAFYGYKTPAIERALVLNLNVQRRRKSLIWGVVNIMFLGFFLYDLSFKCPIYTTWFNYIEYTAVTVFGLNSLYHCFRYIFYTLKTDSLARSESKERNDFDFKDTVEAQLRPEQEINVSPKTPMSLNDTYDTPLRCTPLNWSAVSWRSADSPNQSPNISVTSPSWVFYRGPLDQKALSNRSPQKLQLRDTSGIEQITDEKSLQTYLDDFDHYEKASNASNTSEQPSNLLSTFWSHPATQNPQEISPYLRRTQYQLSSSQTVSTATSTTGKPVENRTSLNVSSLGTEVWRKLAIDPETLMQWNANLRMWISQTILDRLVLEIAAVNEEFVKFHLNDVRIGNVGLERLRKTAQTTPVTLYIPTLATLLPFLEVSPNQEYLVKRIKELSRGGCMSEFKWNSGGCYNGKEWDESLVNDSEIIIHLLSTYLDCQLVPLPNQPDAKPFSKEHLIRHSEKVPHCPLTLAIHQVTEKPPHFRLIVGEEVFEVAKGHNNLFYTVLLFLYFVSRKEHGMLGKVNMGRSGVNMLWIIEEN